ncbi:MAG: hypothetical protein Q9222_004042 [Ikaeria aurantiellina]
MSQPINNCSRKAALDRQEMPTAGTVRSKARAVMDRLKARRDRLVTLARPVASDSASTRPSIKRWTSIRESIGARFSGGVNKPKPAQRPAPRVHHHRQAPPMATLAESKKSSARQAPSDTSGATTGRSFEFIAPVMASSKSLLRPATPQAPRAARFHGINIQPVPFPVLVKTSKVPLKGILKKTGQHKATAKKAVTWGREDETRVVDRWIEGMQHRHPDPTRYLGQLWGWGDEDSEDSWITGSTFSAHHAECTRAYCNKRDLHQYQRRLFYYLVMKTVPEELPEGQHILEFNKEHESEYSRTKTGGRPRLPKDLGLDN